MGWPGIGELDRRLGGLDCRLGGLDWAGVGGLDWLCMADRHIMFCLLNLIVSFYANGGH